MEWTEALELSNRISIVSSGFRYAVLYQDLDALNKMIWNIQSDLDILQEKINDELFDKT